jgi:hypothetical protein
MPGIDLSYSDPAFEIREYHVNAWIDENTR